MILFLFFVFFFKQKTAYEMRISDWSSDVCSSDLSRDALQRFLGDGALLGGVDVMELAPDVGPAGHRDHRPRLPPGNVERVEPGIGIGDEVAGKSGEVALRMLALAVGAVEVGRRRRTEKSREGNGSDSTGISRWSTTKEKT